MEISYGVKVGYFLWSFGLGMALCLLYDFVRCGRRLMEPSVFWVNVEDGLFLFLGGVLLFWIAYDKNGGNLRWHGFLGVGLGCGNYYFLFRDRIMNLSVALAQWGIRVGLKLIRILLIPIQFVYRLMAKPFLVIAWYSRKQISKAERIRKVRQKRRRFMKKRKRIAREQRKIGEKK